MRVAYSLLLQHTVVQASRNFTNHNQTGRSGDDELHWRKWMEEQVFKLKRNNIKSNEQLV